MNIPKLFEGAIAAAITENAGLATDLLRIRTWQAIDADGRWSPAIDRKPPLLDIRAKPPSTSEEDGATMVCQVALLIGTHAEDDPTHATNALFYSAVQDVLDNLYAQFRAGTAGAERNSFDAYISNNPASDSITLYIGGFSHGDGMDPFDDSGLNFIGMTFNIHYSRSDY